ncbi:MAG: hypothetical protein LBT74_12275 [Acidobacteriota bacterium]|jgi:hypothetical protein|nr:hypothetical protein [Acidobacteriota bacterium]
MARTATSVRVSRNQAGEGSSIGTRRNEGGGKPPRSKAGLRPAPRTNRLIIAVVFN